MRRAEVELVTDPGQDTAWGEHDPEEEFRQGRERRKARRKLRTPPKYTGEVRLKYASTSRAGARGVIHDMSAGRSVAGGSRWWSHGGGCGALTPRERIGERFYETGKNISRAGVTYQEAKRLAELGRQEILAVASYLARKRKLKRKLRRFMPRIDLDGVVARSVLARAWPAGLGSGALVAKDFFPPSLAPGGYLDGVDLHAVGLFYEEALVEGGLAHRYGPGGVVITKFGAEILLDPPRRTA